MITCTTFYAIYTRLSKFGTLTSLVTTNRTVRKAYNLGRLGSECAIEPDHIHTLVHFQIGRKRRQGTCIKHIEKRVTKPDSSQRVQTSVIAHHIKVSHDKAQLLCGGLFSQLENGQSEHKDRTQTVKTYLVRNLFELMCYFFLRAARMNYVQFDTLPVQQQYFTLNKHIPRPISFQLITKNISKF